MIRYEILDPTPACRETVLNQIENWKSEGYQLIGFEVSDPDLAKAMNLNVDPQHTQNNPTISAIAEVYGFYLEFGPKATFGASQSTIFCTLRPDMDSVGAMVLASEMGAVDDFFCKEVIDRVHKIHYADVSRTGAWTPSELFAQNLSGFEFSNDLGPIARAVADSKVPFSERVEWVREWLRSGVEPDGYRDAWLAEMQRIKDAFDSGETEVSTFGKVAVVKSQLRAATGIGYKYAPILICYNPMFRFNGGETHLKISICQYSEGYCDMPAILAELREREPGFGGSATFIGSTQGQSSVWTPSEILEVVQKHLL